MQEAREIANDPSTEYPAAPLEVCIPYLSAYMKIDASSPILVRNFRTIQCTCMVFLRDVSLSPMWTTGVILHTEPSGTDFEGGLYHFSYPATGRIHISTAKCHAVYSQRPI